MADEQRMVTGGVQPYVIGDNSFRGLNTFVDANKLESGQLQTAQNVILDGGGLIGRNGFVGVYDATITVTTPSLANSDGIWAMTAYRQAGQTAKILYSHRGQFYVYDTNAGTRTIAGDATFQSAMTAGALYSPNVRATVFGKYIYAVPGLTSGGTVSTIGLMRFNLTSSTAEILPQIAGTPNITPSVKPYVFAKKSVPTTNPHLYIDESVGPFLRTSGDNNMVNNGSFAAAAYVHDYSSWTLADGGWQKVSGDPKVKVIATGISNKNFPGSDQALYSPTTAITKCVELANSTTAFDGIYQDCMWSGGSVIFPDENSNFIDSQTPSGSTPVGATTFSCTLSNSPTNGTVTRTNHGLIAGQKIMFTTTVGYGSANSLAWVLQVVDANSFTVTKYNGSVASSAFTSTGTGAFQIMRGSGLFNARLYAINIDQQSSVRGQSVKLTIEGYKSDGAGNAVIIAGAKLETIIAPAIAKTGRDWVRYNIQADFRAFRLELIYIRIKIENINAADGDGKGIYVTGFELYASSPRLNTIATDATTLVDAETLVKIKALQNNTNVTGYAGFLDGCAIKFTLPTVTTTVTFTGSGSPNVLGTFSGTTALTVGRAVFFTNSGGALPTGLTSGQVYYVISATASIITVSTVLGGSAVTMTGGSGTHTLTALEDWKDFDSVSMRAVIPEAIRLQGPRFRIGLQEPNASIEWGGIAQYDADTGYFSWNIRGLLNSRVDGVARMYIRCETDFKNLFDGDLIMSIGAISINGNLSPSIKYTYRFSRWYQTGTNPPYIPGVGTGASTISPEGFESELSAPSNEITATEALSATNVILNPNGDDVSATNYTHILVYRASTAYPDGQYRCIGSVKMDGTIAYGKDLAASKSGTVFTIIDNVSESSLIDDGYKGSQGGIYKLGQDNFPVGGTALAIHQQRLWMSKANTIYASWLLDRENEYTINTTLLPNPVDPEYSVKGISMDVSSDSNAEVIVNMQAYHGDMMSRNNSTVAVLLVYRENFIYPITGYDPTNYAIQAFINEPGQGLLAPQGVAVISGQPWHINTNGVGQFTGTVVTPQSLPLERLYNLKPYSRAFGVSSISAAAYSKSFLAAHDKYCWLFAPVAGGTMPSVGYVYNTLLKGWTSVTIPSEVTHAVSIASGNDAADLYVGAFNGQIYKYQTFNDSGYKYSPTPASAGSANLVLGTASVPFQNGVTGLAVGDAITFSSYGGFTASTVANIYYIKTISTNTITVCTDAALANAAITWTGSGTNPTFVELINYTWSITTRKYGQGYSEGVAYYAKNKVNQLDIHFKGDSTGTDVRWGITGSSTGSIATIFSQTNKYYTITNEQARAIRGIKMDSVDYNWQVNLTNDYTGLSPYTTSKVPKRDGIKLFGVSLHMIESGIQRHR
jgi:hypothetical protein